MIIAPFQTFLVPRDDAHPVVADYYAPAGFAPGTPHARLVVMCHDVMEHRRSGFIPYVASRLCAAGFGVVSMDFSLNGYVLVSVGAGASAGTTESGNGSSVYVAPELFRTNTLEREHTDLRAVMEWLRNDDTGLPSLLPDGPIGLWGHGRGGVAVILSALDDPRVRAISTWSTRAHPDVFTDADKQQWREAGALTIPGGENAPALELGVEFLEDLEAHTGRYDMVARAGELTAAHLIVHGEHDSLVSVNDGQRFYDVPEMRADKKFLRMFTGRSFAYAPGEPVDDVLRQPVDKTIEWFETYLK